MSLKSVLALVVLLLAVGRAAFAGDSELVARSSRSFWPEPIDSPAAFDRASRAEILAFAPALADAAGQDEAALTAQFHIAQADLASVRAIGKRLSRVLLDNYRIAAASCGAGDLLCDPIADEGALSAAGAALSDRLPAQFRAWYEAARTFDAVYAAELVRLAALFPQISSEITTYSAIESDGFDREDRHFLLTFDDGPTGNGGQTDLLIPILNARGLHALFFLVGETLEARLKQDDAAALSRLYEGQCTGLHGWRHLSHATWVDWQSSIIRTRDLVRSTLPRQYRPWFRPPFGERRPDSGTFFAQNNLRVALWNINSHDWSDFITADQVAHRIARLMLLWRRGVILQHDTHAKAAAAVPWLVDRYRDAGIVWDDCR